MWLLGWRLTQPSVAVIKHHNSGHPEKTAFNSAHGFQESESVRAERRGVREQTSGSTMNGTEGTGDCKSLLHPPSSSPVTHLLQQGHASWFSPNSSTKWGLSIHTRAPIEAILLHSAAAKEKARPVDCLPCKHRESNPWAHLRKPGIGAEESSAVKSMYCA